MANVAQLTETNEFLAPLVQMWTSQFQAAREAKKGFQTVGDQCEAFFSHASGFMWKPAYKMKFMGAAVDNPKFQITINKAFELVSIFGPYLFWQYPHRYIDTYESIDMTPADFGDPDDPISQQMYQMAMREEQIKESRNGTGVKLMERYLNYSQREQPGGGLALESEMAITEALIRGRGLLWVEGYQFPGSGRRLTGCFYDTVNNLLIDADCNDPMLRSAKWIARRHETPDWELEDMFRFKRGTLWRKGLRESMASRAMNTTDAAHVDRIHGKTNDRIVWYEVWSKGGVGSRMNWMDDPKHARLSRPLHNAFDNAVGDYAYLCIAPSIPWPLNAPKGVVARATDEEVRDMFAWRAPNYGPEFPCYLDDRWPVSFLDFHRHPTSPWPIPPLSPGLGELTALNVLMSALVEQGYENRKTIIAYLESAAKDVKGALTGSDNPALVGLNDSAHKSINEVIQYLQRPEMNKDILVAIEYLMELFDKRTGLTEIHYSMNVGGVQSRSARDVSVKEEKASIRPEKMSKDVAKFETDAAQLEKFLAGWTVEGADLVAFLGKYGAFFWDEFIATADPEVFVREMRATVEASDLRRPNKERLATNIQQMLQFMLPILQQYAIDTGNTEPLNAFIQTFGESIEQNVDDWMLGEWRPETDPQQQQMQMMMAQLEQAKLEAEVMTEQADAQRTMAETQKAQVESQKAQFEMQQSANEGQSELQIKAAESQMKMQVDQMTAAQKLQASAQQSKQKMVFDDAAFKQKLAHERESFLEELFRRRAETRAKMAEQQGLAGIKVETAEELGDIKVETAEDLSEIKEDNARKLGAQQVATAKAMPKRPASNGSK